MTERTGEGPNEDPSDTPDADPFEYASDARDDRPPRRADNDRGGGKPAEKTGAEESPSGIIGWLRWFWTTDSSPHVYFRDILTSAMIVVAIGTILFGISGVWPPMVAIESGSMEPNMHEGDLVFIVDNERFVPQEATEVDGVSTGIVPADVAEQHGETAYNGYGDVIIFHPNGNTGRTPIIHRAMFWVDEGENWYDRADPAAVGGADSCEQLRHCPAPNAGFITKGDWNSKYDQATRRSAPVQPGWIIGTAELRVPYLGHVRLLFNGVTVTPDITAAATPEMEYSTEPIGKNSDTADVTAMSPASANRLPA